MSRRCRRLDRLASAPHLAIDQNPVGEFLEAVAEPHPISAGGEVAAR